MIDCTNWRNICGILFFLHLFTEIKVKFREYDLIFVKHLKLLNFLLLWIFDFSKINVTYFVFCHAVVHGSLTTISIIP
jgi:hypothetical protein